MSLFFRQLFDYETYTYTYLIADRESGEAVIIDPVAEQITRDLQLIEELGLRLRYCLDTHVHADHVTGAALLRERTGCKTGVAASSDVSCSDLALKEGDLIPFGRHQLRVIATPGHTNGCLSFHAAPYIFTGDSLFIRGCGRTDFQQGNARTLYRSIHEKLFQLPDETVVCPGHDYRGQTLSTIGEEKRCNPRLTLTEEEFVHYMSELNLPNPKKIMEAIPANQSCGRTDALVAE